MGCDGDWVEERYPKLAEYAVEVCQKNAVECVPWSRLRVALCDMEISDTRAKMRLREAPTNGIVQMLQFGASDWYLCVERVCTLKNRLLARRHKRRVWEA